MKRLSLLLVWAAMFWHVAPVLAQEITATPPASNWESDFSEIKRLFDAQSYRLALAKFDDLKQTYANDPRIAEAYLVVGLSYARDGQNINAASWFLKGYQVDKLGKFAPDNLLYLAQAMRRLGDKWRSCVALREFDAVFTAPFSSTQRALRQEVEAGMNCATATAPTLANEVKLVERGGTYKVPVKLNGLLELDFTVDSGASDVTVPADVVMTLMRTGTIRDTDFQGQQTYRLADGRRISSRTFVIRELTVGNRTVTNVLGSVGDVEGSLLLGQSFLSKFKKVSFDYSRQVLILE